MTLIKDAGLKFPEARTPMPVVTKIVIHHPVANWTIQRIHEYFLGIGYNGSAYNYYVQKNAEAYYGRSSEAQEYQGAHAGTVHNRNTISVCAEGNFDIEFMQAQQYHKLVAVVAFLCIKHRLSYKDVVGHKELPGQSTACPGRNFNMHKFRADVKGKITELKSEGEDMGKINQLEKRIEALEKRLMNPNQEVSSWAKAPQEWAMENKITDGKRPKDPVSREEAWTLIHRTVKST